MKGRIRSVKPELLQDEKLWDLGAETGLPVLQAFVGLWCYVDREGRFEWRPRALKALILPYWEGSMEDVLARLAEARFIVRYEVDGRSYAYVRTFTEHQCINAKEGPSTLPAPPVPLACPSRAPRVEHAMPELENLARVEGNGRELEGKGAGTDPERGREPKLTEVRREEPRVVLAQGQKPTYISLDGWEPPEELYAEAQMLGISRETFDRRLKSLRNLPIGGPKGVFDRTDHVRGLLPLWRTWEESDRAKAAQKGFKVPEMAVDEWDWRALEWKDRDFCDRNALGAPDDVARAFWASGATKGKTRAEGEKLFRRHLGKLAKASRCHEDAPGRAQAPPDAPFCAGRRTDASTGPPEPAALISAFAARLTLPRAS